MINEREKKSNKPKYPIFHINGSKFSKYTNLVNFLLNSIKDCILIMRYVIEMRSVGS